MTTKSSKKRGGNTSRGTNKKSRKSRQPKPLDALQIAEIQRIREKAERDIARVQMRAAEEKRKAAEKKKRDAADLKRGAGLFERAGLMGKAKAPASRKRKVKSLVDQFRDFLDPKKMTFVPTTSKRSQKARERAKELGFKTTPRGFFFPREGAKRVKLKYDRKRGEYAIETQKSEKSKRTGKTKKTTRRFLLERMTTAEKKLEAIKAAADKINPKGKERVSFVVQGPHRGYSKRTYSKGELLVRDIEQRYCKSVGAPALLKGKERAQFLDFLELVSVQKTTVEDWSNKRNALRVEKEQAKEKAKTKKRRKKRKPK